MEKKSRELGTGAQTIEVKPKGWVVRASGNAAGLYLGMKESSSAFC